MDQPDPADVQIERLVERSDIIPDGVGKGKGLLLPAPWELMLMRVADEQDRYRVYWCCPRCLDVGSLGHQVEIEAAGMRFTCESDQHRDERDYLAILPEELVDLKEATDIQVTVNPSIGCRCCGFHCYLEESEYRVLSDWDGADEGRDPSAVFTNRIQHLHEHRPDAYQRVAELVEGGA